VARERKLGIRGTATDATAAAETKKGAR
jgi:hypothetical protein